MSEVITISNGILTAKISTRGAEIVSLKKYDFENIWDGNPDVWPKHSPVPFPICGRLKDGKYTYDGKEYKMEMHGFAPTSEFDIEKQTAESITFLLKASEQTLKIYPFNFEFRVKYDLDGETLYVEYIVTNLDNKKMYFSVGSHEAYVCPEGIEEYSLIFEKKENLEFSLLEGAFLSHKTETFGLCSELPLKYSYFDRDALIFRKLNSRRIALKNKSTGRTISVDFDGIDNLIIWTKNNVKFLCIEPWCGLPDYIDTDHDLTKKPEILELLPNETISKKHIITFY